MFAVALTAEIEHKKLIQNVLFHRRNCSELHFVLAQMHGLLQRQKKYPGSQSDYIKLLFYYILDKLCACFFKMIKTGMQDCKLLGKKLFWAIDSSSGLFFIVINNSPAKQKTEKCEIWRSFANYLFLTSRFSYSWHTYHTVININ